MPYAGMTMTYLEKTDAETGERYVEVKERGTDILLDPILNKGTCFSLEERRALGLEGLLPPAVATEEEQETRAYGNYLRTGDEVHRYLFLAALHDRNETLFYRLLLDHIEEMLPIVYTPTVGKICEQFSHIYRRPRGVHVCTRDRGRIREVLARTPLPDCRIIVATDNEAILGIGDQGVGGMPIPVGKLALYTAAAGFHPSQCLPLDLDVGTENPILLRDPLYLGMRHPRWRGAEYLGLIDEVVEAVKELYPKAILQWEDFSNQNAFEVLDRYRRRIPSFNDDIQGTSAVVVAGVRTALREAGVPLAEARIVFHGAGASGAGCALAVRRALRAEGVPEQALGERVLSLDSRGLLISDRRGLEEPKRTLATDRALVNGWKVGDPERITLAEVVANFRPSVLIGASGQPGAFTEAIVRSMARHAPRPVVLPLSNPTSKSEATPTDILGWTNGAALVGTGSPFDPVRVGDVTFEIGQGNNALVFPGIGLGAAAAQATWLPDGAFDAAAAALHALTPGGGARGASIYPSLRSLRETSLGVARAVASTLVRLGAAPSRSDAELDERIRAMVWDPVYRPYRAV